MHGGHQQAYLGNTPIYLGGDLIVAIDGTQITSALDLSQIMDDHKTGDTVTVTFLPTGSSTEDRAEDFGPGWTSMASVVPMR